MSRRISFIFPLYFEEAVIPKLRSEVMKIVRILETRYEVEIILVNDGSKDQTAVLIRDWYESEKNLIRIISFAKNYGHQIAVSAGQDVATGDAVIIMDSDLQDPPEVALELVKKWENGADIVYAKRSSYNAGFAKKLFGWAFYRVLKNIASVDIPVDTGDFRLLSKRVNEEMKKYKEKSRYLRGMTSLMGYRAEFVEFIRADRYAGTTHYPFSKSLKLALDAITGYSLFPLKAITRLGIIFSGLAFVGGGGYLLYTILSGTAISGWLSMMSFVILFFGVNMLMMGILGEYIGRIYQEVLDRPLYTVDYSLGITKPSHTTIQRVNS